MKSLFYLKKVHQKITTLKNPKIVNFKSKKGLGNLLSQIYTVQDIFMVTTVASLFNFP